MFPAKSQAELASRGIASWKLDRVVFFTTAASTPILHYWYNWCITPVVWLLYVIQLCPYSVTCTEWLSYELRAESKAESETH
jgi:hypothetical protein